MLKGITLILAGCCATPEPVAEKKCSGYVVLDASHVILCTGDTIEHRWQAPKRLKQ